MKISFHQSPLHSTQCFCGSFIILSKQLMDGFRALFDWCCNQFQLPRITMWCHLQCKLFKVLVLLLIPQRHISPYGRANRHHLSKLCLDSSVKFYHTDGTNGIKYIKRKLYNCIAQWC